MHTVLSTESACVSEPLERVVTEWKGVWENPDNGGSEDRCSSCDFSMCLKILFKLLTTEVVRVFPDSSSEKCDFGKQKHTFQCVAGRETLQLRWCHGLQAGSGAAWPCATGLYSPL